MKFTELLQEIELAYPYQTRAFHIIATRYYMGVESLESLRALATVRPCHQDTYQYPELSLEQVEIIIRNR